MSNGALADELRDKCAKLDEENNQLRAKIAKLEAERDRLIYTNDEWLKFKERFGWSFETAEEAEGVILHPYKKYIHELEQANEALRAKNDSQRMLIDDITAERDVLRCRRLSE